MKTNHEGVAVTLYFGSEDNYKIVGFSGSKEEAKRYFANLIRKKEVASFGTDSAINFALVTHFKVKG